MNLHHLLTAVWDARITLSMMAIPNAKHLSDNQRYTDGYNDGTHAASTDREDGNRFNPACDPTGVHTTDGQHTTTYCSTNENRR